MVNNRTDKIETILTILKNTGKHISGEELAAATGVSRVAVWKIITGLKEQGYTIESAHSGYRLVSATDKPFPWEMESAGRIEYHDRLDSTMSKAALLMDSGCDDGTTVIAGRQTAGKATNGSMWSSPEGGLYFTRIRTAPFPAVYAGLYTVSIAAAAVRVLRKKYKIDACIRWPGGIQAGEKKLGGVLTEFRGGIDSVSSAAAGLGLNLNESENLPEGATSLDAFFDGGLSVKKITSDILGAVAEQEPVFYSDILLNEYREYIRQMGSTASIRKTTGQTVKGRIIDLHYSGCLLLQTEDSKIEHIYTGETIHYE